LSVDINISDGVRHINVLGEVNFDIEQDLLSALRKRDPKPVEVSFYDASKLTTKIVSALNTLQIDNDALRIIVYHHTLASYLYQLGFSCRHKSTVRTNSNTPTVIKALALGGSADSLDKIIHIIAHLPKSEVVVFIVQHVNEDKPHMFRTPDLTDFAMIPV
jgi:chemotaxis protein methyltransferase CheR